MHSLIIRYTHIYADMLNKVMYHSNFHFFNSKLIRKSLCNYNFQVTSGYNSDAISDHEYENIRVLTQGSNEGHCKYAKQEDGKEEEEEEEDNYVILRAVKENADTDSWVSLLDRISVHCLSKAS